MHRKDPISFARDLRRKSTSSEEYLWQLLRNRQRCGRRFRRQHPVAPYTTDFFCVEAKLDVEVDGTPHQTSNGKEMLTSATTGCAFKALGCCNSRLEVEHDTQDVLKRIDEISTAKVRRTRVNSRCCCRGAWHKINLCSPLPCTHGRGGEGEAGSSFVFSSAYR